MNTSGISHVRLVPSCAEIRVDVPILRWGKGVLRLFGWSISNGETSCSRLTSFLKIGLFILFHDSGFPMLPHATSLLPKETGAVKNHQKGKSRGKLSF